MRWITLASFPVAGLLISSTLFAFDHPRAEAQEIQEKLPPISLSMPIDCMRIKGCFIQNYVDIDPSSERRDYSCGHLTYDGHKGTDFRLHNLREMREGVPVLAAADGVVKAIRDTMPDQNFRQQEAAVKNVECGNGVLLFHEGGWETQYCHLKHGSVQVKAGDKIKAGQQVGLVGLSGMTEFPHLHLETRYRGQIVDPFTGKIATHLSSKTAGGGQTNAMATKGLDEKVACDPRLHHSLWDEEARKQLGYITTSLLGAGFSSTQPKADKMREGDITPRTLPTNSEAIYFWVDVVGIRKDDVSVMMMTAPDGTILASHEEASDRPRASIFRFLGAKLKEEKWPAGNYKGVFILRRGEEQILVVREHIEIK